MLQQMLGIFRSFLCVVCDNSRIRTIVSQGLIIIIIIVSADGFEHESIFVHFLLETPPGKPVLIIENSQGVQKTDTRVL